MTTMEATTIAQDSKQQRYRAAERRLWDRYGITPREHFIETDDPRCRLRVVEVGSGQPVIFVPGTGGVGPYWAPLVQQLAGFQCLLVDRPGWGLSTPIDYRRRALGDVAATMLSAVQSAFGHDRSDVVGASVGGLWGLGLAARTPSAVRRLVMIGGSPWREVPIPQFFRILASPVGAAIVRMPLSAEATAGQIAANGHGPSVAAGKFSHFITWRLSLTSDTPSMKHERSMVRAYLGRNTWREGFLPTDAELASIHQPARMLFGSADPTGSSDIWRRFVDLLPNAELEVVDGAGHMPWWDDPERVGQSLRQFLSA